MGPLVTVVHAADALLRHAAEEAGGSPGAVTYKHVKGHSGHPWNEASDWLASARAEHLPLSLVGPHAEWARAPYQMAAAVQLLLWASKGLGPPVVGNALELTPSDPPALPPGMALGAGHDLGGRCGSAPAVLKMQVAVANVLSLSPKEERDGGVRAARGHLPHVGAAVIAD